MTQLSQTQQGVLSKNDISTLIQAGILPAGVPVSQVNVFAQVCRELQLSPFTKEIYLFGYKMRDGSMKYARIVGIDGYRKIAKKDPQFAGVTEAIFDQKSDGSYKTSADLIIENKLPVTATVTAYRLVEGQKVSYTHTAVFKEFNTGREKWAEMPFQMISKVAESFAYRKAFAVSGVHIEEEIGALKDEVQPNKLNDTDMLDAKVKIAKCKKRTDFTKLLKDNPSWKRNEEILNLMESRNQEIVNNATENSTTATNK